MKFLAQKPNLRKYLKRTLTVLGILFVWVVIDALLRLMVINGPPLTAKPGKFLIANPVNLEQVVGISKFRSCQGHTFAAKGGDGVIEAKRSMKHYLAPKEEIRNQLNTIEVFAPLDGKVVFAMSEGKGDQVIISPPGQSKWGLVLFHVDRLPGIETGSQVKAGQLIGYANVKDRHDFDIALTYTKENLLIENILKLFRGSAMFPFPKNDYLVSLFDYMGEDVLAEFEAAGFDTADLKYNREYRDQNPCDFDAARISDGDWQYQPGYEEVDEP